MEKRFTVQKPCHPSLPLVVLVPLALSLVECSSQLVAVAPATPYPVQQLTRLRRKDPTQPAIVFGHIDVSENGKLFPTGATVGIAKEPDFTYSDKNGNYVCVLSPGTHSFQAAWIGLITSVADLQVRQGDSLRLDFHLRVDPTPLHSN